MGFSRQEYWGGLSFPSLGNLPNPEVESRSPALQANSPPEPPGPACQCRRHKRLGSILGLGRSPGVGICYPPQYSCLENSMYSGAWQATVHGVTKSQTWLSIHTCKHININLVTQYLTASHRWKMLLKRRVMEREYKKWTWNFRFF